MSTPVEALVRTVLLNDPEVASAVGTRIYPLVLPQGGLLPAIIYQRIARTHIDPLERPERLSSARLQFDCFAASYGAVKELAQDVHRCLNGYTDQVTQTRPAVRGIRAFDDERDGYESTPGPVYRVTADYSVWWEED